MFGRVFLSASVFSLLALSSPAFAGVDMLDHAAKVCGVALSSSGEQALTEQGFAKAAAKPANPFGEKTFEGKIENGRIAVTIGKKFRAPLCEVYFQDGTESEYNKMRDSLLSIYKTEGTVYDHDVDGKTYRGQIWADSNIMDNGTVDGLKFETIDAADVFIQFSAKPFQQTQDRTGILVEIMGR